MCEILEASTQFLAALAAKKVQFRSYLNMKKWLKT